MKLRDLFSGDAVVGAQHADVAVAGIAVDSRVVKPGDVFFALAGTRTDGARFIDQAIASGAVAVVSDRVPESDGRVAFIA
ncbi:MAG TPA: UDP-N-acetylmuramoyl-L-alanyl-D-glutamate--2,6-diaminopimelate ligase, partial [Afipia sp.]|nr:UDP-N-acetylmuramoyl-L-alanyl-D-glutamate--2,6-diaminopimelate ligase [Afipia sp.]